MNRTMIWSVIGVTSLVIACGNVGEESTASSASAIEACEDDSGNAIPCEDATPTPDEDSELVDCGSGGGGDIEESSDEVATDSDLSATDPDVIAIKPKPITPPKKCKPVCGTDEGAFTGCSGKAPGEKLSHCTCTALSSSNPRTGFTRCACR